MNQQTDDIETAEIEVAVSQSELIEALEAESLDKLLHNYPVYEKLAEYIEEMRNRVDDLEEFDDSAALKVMIEVDTNMMKLMNYHMRLSTALLRASSR